MNYNVYSQFFFKANIYYYTSAFVCRHLAGLFFKITLQPRCSHLIQYRALCHLTNSSDTYRRIWLALDNHFAKSQLDEQYSMLQDWFCA